MFHAKMLLIFICLFTTIASIAENKTKQNTKQIKKMGLVADSLSCGSEGIVHINYIPIVPFSGNDTIENPVAMDCGELLNSIERINKENIRLRADSLRLGREIVSEERKLNLLQGKYDTLFSGLEKIDGIIYKQCLLYPLEARYDVNSVNESIRSVELFLKLSIKPSKEFEECRTTYEPLLRQYGDYNQQLITFFHEIIHHLQLVEWEPGEGLKDKFVKELKSQPYYTSCFIVRNRIPYKSIIYLDNIIEKFLQLLKNNRNLENDMNELVNSLQPKHNIKQ